MWICLNNSFVSAVETEPGSKWLKVRARKRRHLIDLFGRRTKITTSDKADYRFRVLVTKKEFAAVIADRINNIDYGNFKDSVADKQLHDLYADFWRLHFAYQEDFYPYGPNPRDYGPSFEEEDDDEERIQDYSGYSYPLGAGRFPSSPALRRAWGGVPEEPEFRPAKVVLKKGKKRRVL